QIASQSFHTAFARAIWRKTWERQLVVHGADIDDLSTLPRAHPPSDRRLRDKEQTLEVDVQDEVIIFFADFPKRRVLLDAGIVHEYVHSGEMGDRLCYQTFSVSDASNISLNRKSAPPDAFDLANDFLGTVSIG